MTELTFFGSVDESGKLHIRDRKGFIIYIRQFAGKDVIIDVKRKKTNRSLQQNAFFHSWINLLSEHTGYDFEEMKEIVKFKFLKTEKINENTGEVLTFIKHTSKLNKEDFAEFCNNVQKWCNEEFNIRLPLPNENWEITYND